MIFHVPIPPSTNNLFATVRNFVGRNPKRVRSVVYKAWADKASQEIIAQRVPRRGLEGDIALTLTVGPRDKRSDLSNRIKAVEDLCVTMNIIKDDSQVTSLKISWGAVVGCRVEIESVLP